LREGLPLVDFLNRLLLQTRQRRCFLRHGISCQEQSTTHNPNGQA
jgi:hypothetical protein